METKGVPFFHNLTRSVRCTPDCIIIGVQKGGTTALFDYLIQHKQVLSPIKKEIWFFNNSRLFSKGLNWYRSYFPLKMYKRNYERRIGMPSIVLDATANYFEFSDSVTRIDNTIPHAKLILLLRNPVKRAYSHYRMAVDRGYESQGFERALELEDQRLAYGRTLPHNYVYQRLGYKTKGEYARLLKPWLSAFDKSQLLILRSEDLENQTESAFRKVEEFLGLSKHNNINFSKVNVGSKEKIDEDILKSLTEYYRDHNKELKMLLGDNFDW